MQRAGAVVIDSDVVAVQNGLTQFANFSKGFASAADFGRPLPFVAVVPGAPLPTLPTDPPGGLGFIDLLPRLLTARVASTAPQHFSDLSGLATGAAGIDLEPHGRHVVTTATTTAASAGVPETLTLGMVVTRTVDAGLTISSASPVVQLFSSKGVATQLTLNVRLIFAYDPVANFFYLVRDATAPAFNLDATASIPTPAALNASLGILDVQAVSSTFAVATHHVGTLTDANHDGKLAFAEPASGGVSTPGELATVAKPSDLVQTSFAASPVSSAGGTINLNAAPSAIPGLNFDGLQASVTVTAPDLSSSTPPVISTSALDSRLRKFETLTPPDLLTDVNRLAFAVQNLEEQRFATAGHGNTDLPFLKGSLADAVHAN